MNEALRLAQIQWTRRGPPNKRWLMFYRSLELSMCVLWREEILRNGERAVMEKKLVSLEFIDNMTALGEINCLN